jgi:hypothetical protein
MTQQVTVRAVERHKQVSAQEAAREGVADLRAHGYSPLQALALVGVSWSLPLPPSWQRVENELAALWDCMAHPPVEGGS